MRKIVAQYADMMTATPYLADRDVINADAISTGVCAASFEAFPHRRRSGWCFASFSTGYIK
jgi:hypothetical protein